MSLFTADHFIKMMMEAALHMDSAIHKGLEASVEIAAQEARSSLGTQQAAVGPVAAWADLSDATKADRVAKGYPEDEPLLRDGTLRDSITTYVGEGHAIVGSTAEAAPALELGTDKMPGRSFLQGAVYRKLEDIEATLIEHVGQRIVK